jgi:hypothetical protein
MYGVMGEVEARLMGPVGCSSVTWLDSPALAAAIRTVFAPGDRAGLTAADIAAQNDPNVASTLPIAAAGPTSTPNPERRFYAHDAWQTVTCTILPPDKGAGWARSRRSSHRPQRRAALGNRGLEPDQP